MLKNFFFFIFLFPTFILGSALHAARLKTLSLDFRRELKEALVKNNSTLKGEEKNKTETTIGTLHYDAEAKQVVVEVSEPLVQIMIVKDKALEIYYPVEKQAFRFISDGKIPLPFIEAILQTTQPEYGLTLLGYSLDKHEIKGDVLYTYWVPPEKEKERLGTVIMGMRNDLLISMEVRNPDGNLAAKSVYEQHIKLGTNHIPMAVTASVYAPQSALLQHERIIYSNPRMNEEPLNPILNFTIPESVKVREIKW